MGEDGTDFSENLSIGFCGVIASQHGAGVTGFTQFACLEGKANFGKAISAFYDCTELVQ